MKTSSWLSAGVVCGLLVSGFSLVKSSGTIMAVQGGGVGAKLGARAPVVAERLVPIDGVTDLGQGIFRIVDPRPLGQLAVLLQQKVGVPISYEEEVLQFSGDQVAASELPANRELVARTPSWRGPLVPRLGTVDLTIPSPQILKEIGDPTQFIQEAIANHKSNQNVGEFKLVRIGDNGFSIVMNRVASQKGEMTSIEPMLETRISFPEKERSLEETIELISMNVAAAGKKGFVGGPAISSYLTDTLVRIGAQNEPARDVLARALKVPGGYVLSWDLSAVPGGFSALVVRPVKVEILTDGIPKQLQVLFWPR